MSLINGFIAARSATALVPLPLLALWSGTRCREHACSLSPTFARIRVIRNARMIEMRPEDTQTRLSAKKCLMFALRYLM
jgi:hypothetical protein